MKRDTFLYLAGIPIAGLFFIASVTPEDSSKALGKWGALAVEILPDRDRTVMYYTAWVLAAIIAIQFLRWLARVAYAVWMQVRAHGVWLVRPAKRVEMLPLSPMDALLRFADRQALRDRQRRIALLVQAKADAAICEHAVQRAKRNEPRHVGPGAWPKSREFRDARDAFHAALARVENEQERYDVWEQPFRAALTIQLQRGELVAHGYVDPRLLAGTEIAIQPAQWSFLVLDFENDTATGQAFGLVYHHVRITQRQVA